MSKSAVPAMINPAALANYYERVFEMKVVHRSRVDALGADRVRRPFVRTAHSESHIRQCAACVEVGRHADVSPALCVGCTGRLGVAGVLCRVAA